MQQRPHQRRNLLQPKYLALILQKPRCHPQKRQIADESSDDKESSSNDEPPPPKKHKHVIQDVTDEEPEEDDVEIVDNLENTQ